MRKLYIIIALVLVCQFAQGQKLFLQGQLQNGQEYPKLKKVFNNYEVYKIDLQQLNDNQFSNPQISHLQLHLGDHQWSINLTESELISESYQLQVIGNVNEPTRRSVPINYIGDFNEGKANLTITNQLVLGSITDGDVTYYLEPLNRYLKEEADHYWVLYQGEDVKPNPGFRCGLPELMEEGGHIIQPRHTHANSSGCIQIDYALAADYSMYAKFEDLYDLEAYILAVLSLSQENFNDDNFTATMQFKVVAMSVSTCEDCDPWDSSTDSEAVLRSFGDWGNDGGFGMDSFHLASLWTDRVLADSLAGLSWLGEMCNDLRYNILSDYTDNLLLLKTLQSHEIGHNLGAIHIRQGDNTIMAPRINVTDKWSIWTRLRINSTMETFKSRPGCLTGCDELTPPNVAFSVDVQSGCSPFTASFAMNITGEHFTPKWIFEGGNPSVSFEDSPTVQYDEPGTYEVLLMAQNTAGADTLIQTSIIEVGGAESPDLNVAYEIGGSEAAFMATNADSVVWDLGDGTLSTDLEFLHNYQEDGIYNITLVATSDCGIDTLRQELKVVTLPVVSFLAENTTVCPASQIQFINNSQAFEGTYFWEFEGGFPESSTELSPAVTYNESGNV